MSGYSQTSSPPTVGLRERRRRELVRSIASTAVDLFEQKGFPATTIDDIAETAGISRSTFFRYCATKEATVLVDDAGLEMELVAIAEAAATDDPLRALESAWQQMTDVFDADADGRDRFLRVRRLMRDNPPLLAAGLERDARLSATLATAIERGGVDSLDAHVVAESFAVGMRLTFDEWVRLADDASTPPALGTVYKIVRAALRRATEPARR